jgi:phage gpG-like protein
MSAISLSVSNVKELQAAINKIGGKAERNVSRAIEATALGINRDVKDAIQRGDKTGRVYQRGNITHRASAPGEAPATDTGTLVSSIYYEPQSGLLSMIGSRLAYAYYLEFGTMRIAPRPSWMPAVEANREKFNRLIEEGLRRAMP